MAKEDVLYQHGTLALLVPGLYYGTQSIADLLTHGDTGIGTADGLDGEMVILAGHAYQISGKGKVREMASDELTPFANVHFDQPTNDYDRQNISSADLEKEIFADHQFANQFFAIKIHGTFSHVQTRAIDKQKPPYPPLAEAAKSQHVFEKDDVTGTLIGYYSPDLYQGTTSAGFHVHFLDDDHTFGGHILAYALTEGKVSLQTFSDFNLHLPVYDSHFVQADLNDPELDKQIKAAEH
ncbi:acetolactate decarboxylase [Schleiferilactobacillus perolens]|jgi:acetolactate decarboxylase|uniref:acetolactate decarboxylase n=1 Tax=Schleiferilactobacillus perolens TaxID=100468 RepID=UPI00235423D0|nr:acetolactate decarboxylase [Schleiferilactobacillus perolens]MCI1890619.1 acetolactate decarboxylase [Schleiferilactobacillus harbinensis]MCI1912166.1 acetolactate decarboxylase [Schleiferilactobacillus harbinensis]MCI2172194.1 acetolactate decarboxylase [Schleiferilactobacillus perolens]